MNIVSRTCFCRLNDSSCNTVLACHVLIAMIHELTFALGNQKLLDLNDKWQIRVYSWIKKT